MSGLPDQTVEIQLTKDELLGAAQERLRMAIDMLGRTPEELLLDDTVVGAAVLARDASELLQALARERGG